MGKRRDMKRVYFTLTILGGLLAISIIAYGTLSKYSRLDRWKGLESVVKDKPTVDEKLAETWGQRDTLDGIEQAVWLLKRVVKQEPENWEALVQLAYAHCLYATLYLEDTAEKMKTFKEGEECGRKANELNPYSSGAKYWTGVNLAGWAMVQSKETKTVWSLWEARTVLERLMFLDDTYFHGGPYVFWGVYFTNVSRALGRNVEQAKRHFEKALKVEDKFLPTYLLYVENYLLRQGEKDKAKEILAKALTIPTDLLADAAPENRIARKRIVELWEKHFSGEEVPQISPGPTADATGPEA